MEAEIEDLYLELWLRRRNCGTLVHTTKNNTKVPMKDMTDQHLINTIQYLSKKEDIYECDFDDLNL